MSLCVTELLSKSFLTFWPGISICRGFNVNEVLCLWVESSYIDFALIPSRWTFAKLDVSPDKEPSICIPLSYKLFQEIHYNFSL